jgi:hypothetical protein
MSQKIKDNKEDYIWRFSLHDDIEAPVYKDPLIEIIRVFLEDFLSFGFLVKDGKQVDVDSFGFNEHPDKFYKIFKNRNE